MKALFVCVLVAAAAFAEDYPQWGRTHDRNMISPEKNLPDAISVHFGSNGIIKRLSTNFLWAAPVGYYTFGNPTVADGRLFIGTSRYKPTTAKYAGDRGVLTCLDAMTGQFVWQISIPRYGSGGFLSEYPLGMCSPPTVENGRVYFAGYNAEIICADINGLSNGNEGPFTNEASFYSPSNRVKLDNTDGDIVWRFDVYKAFGVMPHDGYSSAPLIIGDLLFANTGVGTTRRHKDKPPMTNAPALIVLDKRTGAFIAGDEERMATNTKHGTWCSPSFAKAGGKELVLFGGGNGICYAFEKNPVITNKEQRTGSLRTVWKYNLNLARGTNHKPSDIIATPVCVGNRVYTALGEDWTHRSRQGLLVCIDATKTGDITTSGAVWAYTNIALSVANAAVADGLLYTTDLAGIIHCLDAANGTVYWTFDSGYGIYQSALVADGKVYFGNGKGQFYILAHGKTLKVLSSTYLRMEMCGAPVAANGVLYTAVYGTVFAFKK
ncbi:MAG: PQQ-binding-like beta-propeller repeat protein [Spirochaetota bacterium]